MTAPTPAERFALEHPDHFFLDPEEPASLEIHLRRLDILSNKDTLTQCRIAGDGNMNCTLRVTTSAGHSFIVKQARPWVEKYPQFDAPWERILREGEFYRHIQDIPQAARMMPRLLAIDPKQHLLILQDLGQGGDYRSVYQRQAWQTSDLQDLAQYLSALHHHPQSGKFANRAMRELNHAHIFAIPLQADNGLDLNAIQPGLADAAAPLLGSMAYCQRVAEIGQEAYLADGPCLLHGDFFPGSLIKTADGPRVIDPEFAFFGRPEFDTGVFLAHMHLAKQPQAAIDTFTEAYDAPANYDSQRMQSLCGIEIMRRLIGYAQLELPLSLDDKANLLEQSVAWVLHS